MVESPGAMTGLTRRSLPEQTRHLLPSMSELTGEPVREISYCSMHHEQPKANCRSAFSISRSGFLRTTLLVFQACQGGFGKACLALARWCAQASASTTAQSLRAVRSWLTGPDGLTQATLLTQTRAPSGERLQRIWDSPINDFSPPPARAKADVHPHSHTRCDDQIALDRKLISGHTPPSRML